MFLQTTMDGKFGELHEQTTALGRYVQDAAREGTAAHEVEKEIWARVLKIGGQAFGHFLTAQGTGDVGETFTMPEGQVLKRLEQLHAHPYQSIFGAYDLNRAVYGTREGRRSSGCRWINDSSCPRAGTRMSCRIGIRLWAQSMPSPGSMRRSR